MARLCTSSGGLVLDAPLLGGRLLGAGWLIEIGGRRTYARVL
jgi:hypothetical protein